MELRRTLALWPFAALCLLLATRWMFADAWPATSSTASSEGAAALLGLLMCLALGFRERSTANARTGLPGAFFAGLLLFTAVSPGLLFPSAMPKGTDLMASLSLTPVVIAVALIAMGAMGGTLVGADLLPGLCAGAGLLIILPQPTLSSYPADAVLLLAPLLIGTAATWLGARAQQPLLFTRAAAALAGPAVLFSALSLRSPRSLPAPGAIGLDLLTMLLTLLTLKQCGVRRFGAQFAMAPLLLLLEGLVFARVRPNWQQTGGLLLLVAASALLLRQPNPEEREENPRLFT